MQAPLDHKYGAYGNALRVRFNAEVCKRRPQPRIFTSLRVKGFPIIPGFGDVAVRGRVTYQEPSFPRSTRMDHGGATDLYNVRYAIERHNLFSKTSANTTKRLPEPDRRAPTA